MRLRNVSGSRDHIAESSFVIKKPQSLKGSWKSLFKNDNPIHIEVGMGKGQFLYTMAELHPEINYIGIEKFSSVLVRAVQKLDENPLPNIFLLRMDAQELTDVFDKGEISRIYLNFSDPWPKDRHAKRRLPSKDFLLKYDVILQKDGIIEFKTDNINLFNFGVEELEDSPFKARVITYDLHADEKLMVGNVMTEYEERFSAMGNPICKYILERR